jgi:hypothetical protein
MLASIVALHLVLLAQAPATDPAPASPADDAKVSDHPDDALRAEAAPSRNPPLPPRSQPSHSSSAVRAEQPVAADTGTLPPPVTTRSSPGLLSLLSAEPLAGGSAGLAWAGWSSFGAAWAQGITDRDDLGLATELDWATTEFRLGGFYRRPLGTAGPFDMAGRLGLGWYANFGGTWIEDDNEDDRGVEVTPGLSLSTRGAGGVFSILGEAPITVTVRRDAGLLFSPRLSAAYEAPLYGDYTVGALVGLGYRAGAGDAPLGDGRAELRFLVLGGARLF